MSAQPLPSTIDLDDLFGSISQCDEDCAGEEADVVDLTCDEDHDRDLMYVQWCIRVILKDHSF